MHKKTHTREHEPKYRIQVRVVLGKMFSIYLSVDIRLFSFCVKYKIVYLVVVCLSKNEPFQSDLVLWYRRSNKNVIAYFDDSKRTEDRNNCIQKKNSDSTQIAIG